MDLINKKSTVLIIYEDEAKLDKYLSNLKIKPKELVTKIPGEVLNLNSPPKFSVILSGVVSPHCIQHDGALLTAIIKMSKPDAAIVLHQIVKHSDMSRSHLLSQLTLSGFTKIHDPQNVQLTEEDQKIVQQKLNITDHVTLIEYRCYKPNFEVGSSAKLSLKPKIKNTSAVWKLDGDDNDESINPDELLDEDDLAKPDAAGLRVCSTTGKRKACKNCSCGLAEELSAEKQSNEPAPKSACGSCYLGDAFRCATCPYLGMPAFKPGEKVMLSDKQLTADS